MLGFRLVGLKRVSLLFTGVLLVILVAALLTLLLGAAAVPLVGFTVLFVVLWRIFSE